MSHKFVEDTVEQAAIDWLREIGYDYIHGGLILPASLPPKLVSGDLRVGEL